MPPLNLRTIMASAVLMLAGGAAVAQQEAPTSAKPAPSDGAKATVETNIDRPGLDYRNFVPSAADPEECRRVCEQEQRCRAYAYRKAAQDGSARCWLKAAIPQPYPNACCTSGTKGSPEPGAVKALFEKHDLIGVLAEADCTKPPSRDNRYLVTEVIDPDHVLQTAVSAPEGNAEARMIDGVVELTPSQIAFTGREADLWDSKQEGAPLFGEWQITAGRLVELRRWQIYDQHYYLRVRGGKSLTANASPPSLRRCAATTAPRILSVSHVNLDDPDQWIAITGSGFGKHDPYVGNSAFIRVSTSRWSGGSTRGSGSDPVTLSIRGWTDSQIRIDGLRGAYAQQNMQFVPDEKVTFEVWNAQTGVGPATFSAKVSGPPK